MAGRHHKVWRICNFNFQTLRLWLVLEVPRFPCLFPESSPCEDVTRLQEEGGCYSESWPYSWPSTFLRLYLRQ